MDNHNLQRLKRKVRYEERCAIARRMNEYFHEHKNNLPEGDKLRQDLSYIIHNMDGDED